MTTQDDNKNIVLEYFRNQDAGELDAMFSVVANDVKIWHPIEGDIGKEAFRRIFEALQPNLNGNTHNEIISLTAEADRVAAQVVGRVTLKDDRHYVNRYCWLFVIRNGLIVEMFDYADTWPWRKLDGPELLGAASKD